MSYCSRPAKTKKTNFGASATKKVNPPAPRTETCAPASSTVVSGGGSSTENTVYVPGPAGPAGVAGQSGLGFEWKGTWTIGVAYFAQSTEHPLASVVFHNGSSWIATIDNTSTSAVTPEFEPGVASEWQLMSKQALGFEWKGQFALNVNYYAQSDAHPLASVVEYAGSSYVAVSDNISTTEDPPEYEPGNSSAWQVIAAGGSNGTVPGLSSGFNLADAYDWVTNASVSELLDAAIAGVGIVLAGAVITSMLTDTGAGDGEADQRYTGSDGLLTGAVVKPTLPDVLAALCTQAGVDYDTSLLPADPCEFVIGNATSTRSIIQQLSLVYGFDMVDTGTALKFIPRNVTSVATFTFDDMGFGVGLEPSPKFVAARFQGIDLPRTVTVKYYSSELDYNTFTQTSELFPYTTGQDVSFDVPLTLPHAKAKEVAEIALINSHLERQTYTWTSTYKFIGLEPGDVVTTPMGLLRVTKVNEMNEGLIEITAVEAGGEGAIEGSDLSVVIPPVSTNVPTVIGYSQGLFFDPPVLNSGDSGVRLYAAVHGYDAAGWPGASIYVSDDAGATYSLVTTVYQEATVGLVALATPSADFHVWDETTTISVQLKTNELTSKSELAVLNGANRALIGNEVIGFKNAVLTGPKTYTLSGLLRGRQGTEQFVTGHAVDELFVMLDDVTRITLNTSQKGVVRKYKVVTVGSSLDKVDAQDVASNSINTRPWTPLNVKVTKIGSDYQFSWDERARFDNKLRDGSVSPRDSDWGGALVAIMDGAVVKKSYVNTGGNFTYTTAMQSADFGSVQSTITGSVMQYSTTYGAGYPVSVSA